MSSQASRFTLVSITDILDVKMWLKKSERTERIDDSELVRWCWCKKHECAQTVDILRQGKTSRINQVLHVFPTDVLFVLICWKTKTPRTLNCIWTIQRVLADTCLSDHSNSQFVSCADFFRFLVKDHETRRQLSLVPLVCFLHTFGPKIWRERAVLVHTRL